MSHNPRLTNNQTITASYTLDDNLVVYGQNTYTYDDDGYLTEKTTPQGTTTYTYGTLGELLEVTTPTKTITYKHNANNQRVAKLVNGTVVEKYLWADLTTLLAIYDANDNLIQRFEYVNDRMPVAMTDANNTKYYLHYDQVGSLRAVSDTNHNIVKEIVYDTFGNILTDTNPTLKVPFGFAGGLYDADTKLTRFGYRDYDAYVGKWTAKDPIGFGGGDSNLYGYVLGDPVNLFDANGLFPSASVLWDNKNFISHYFFGGGQSMNISPNSPLGQKIINHINDIMKKRYNDAIKHACEDYSNTTIDKLDFTNISELFSLGDSSLRTKVFCGNGRCLIRYQIRDWFRDARDLHDTEQGMQEYPGGKTLSN